MDTTITTTTKDGKKVTYTAEEYLGKVLVSVAVDGRQIASGAYSATAKKVQSRTVYGTVHGSRPIYITNPETASKVAEAVDALKSAIDQRDALPKERKTLVMRCQMLADEIRDAERAAVEMAMSGVPARKADTAALEAELEAAREALAEFDRQHPEIKAAIEAERKAALERNLWN